MTKRAYTRAITFGSRHEEEARERGVDFIRRDGYVVIEADDQDQLWEKALEVFGEAYPDRPGTPAFSFDYDLEKFVAEEDARGAQRYYPLGELARFEA